MAANKKTTPKTLTVVPVAPKFDYESLKIGGDTISVVVQKTEETKVLLKRTAENIIQVGQNLLDVKDMLPHGAFQPWLQAEFSMSYPTAVNFMRVAERFGGKDIKFIDLPISVLYELAAPSTPDDVVEKVVAGEIAPTNKAVKQAKADAKQPQVDSVGNELANVPQVTPTPQPSEGVAAMKVVETPAPVETPPAVRPEQELQLTPGEQATSDFYGKTHPAAQAAANAALAASDFHTVLRGASSSFAVSCDALIVQVDPLLKSVDQFTDADWNSIRRLRVNLNNVARSLAKFEGKLPGAKPAGK